MSQPKSESIVVGLVASGDQLAGVDPGFGSVDAV